MLFEPRVIKSMRREGVQNPHFVRKTWSICPRHHRRREQFSGEKDVIQAGRAERVQVKVFACPRCNIGVMEAVPESPFAWDPPFETKPIFLY